MTRNKHQQKHNISIATTNTISDDEEVEYVDESYRAEYGDNFHYENENGFWAPNTDFNSEGLPVDENGNILKQTNTQTTIEDDDDFDYSKFLEPPSEDEIKRSKTDQKNAIEKLLATLSKNE